MLEIDGIEKESGSLILNSTWLWMQKGREQYLFGRASASYVKVKYALELTASLKDGG